MQENRIIERFALELPVSIKIEGTLIEEACTKDISSRGVFVKTSNHLEAFTQVDLAIQLPLKKGQKESRQNTMKVKGKVVRIDTDGMAIFFDRESIIS